MNKRPTRVLTASLAGAIVVAGLGFAPGEPAAAADPSIESSKVLELNLDGNLTDTSPAAHPVTMHAGTAAYVEGISGQAFNFNGSSVISLGTAADLQPEDLTLSFWYKPDADMGNGEQVFTWNKTVYNSAGWYLSSENGSTPLALSIGPSTGQPYKVDVTGPRADFFPTGQWTHVVVTYDGESKDVNFYRNGVWQPTNVRYGISEAATGVLTSDATMLKTIGFNGPTYRGAYLRGSIDDWFLYDAVASDADAVVLHQQHVPTFDPGTVAQSDLDALTLPESATHTFTLPTQGNSGSAISWLSDSPYVQISEGTATITRPVDVDATAILTASSTYAGSEPVTRTFELTIPVAGATGTAPFLALPGLAQVDINDPYLVNAHDKTVDYLLSLDSEKFLHSFYLQAGMTPTTDSGYGGWEAATGTRFQGHFFGHYITALSQAYSVEQDAARKAALLAEITEAVEGLEATQAAYAQLDPANAGYVSPFPVRYLPSGGEGLLVPFYNLHKVLAGLLDAHQYAPAELGDRALAVASGFGTFVMNYGDRQADPNSLLRIEYGGMNEALYELFGLTRDPAHKRAAEYFDEVTLFRALAENRDVLAGLHANTTIPKLVGAMTRYELFTQDPELYETLTEVEKGDLDMYRRAAVNFWQIVVDDHTYANGGNSYSEHFHGADTLFEYGTSGVTSGYGENSTSEGCNEYNMLKLTNQLFRATKDVKYADFYESTYINSVVATQNPETGMVTYFQPMTAGYAKVFGDPFGEFWCDHGTGIEKFTMLSAGFYATDAASVYVNQFYSSTYTSAQHGLVLTQTGDIPNTDTVTLSVGETGDGLAAGTVLRLRKPAWLAGDPTLTINGSVQDLEALPGGVTQVAGYASFTVAVGDEITWQLPAQVTVSDDTENPNWVAFKYGPVLLATELSRENVQASYVAGVLVKMSVADKSLSGDIVVEDAEAWKANIAENLVRMDNFVGDDGRERMAFQLQGVDAAASDLVFEPYYSLYQARYGLYMTLIEPDSAEAQAKILREKEQLREAETTVDSLTSFDNNNSEAGANYEFSSNSTVGSFGGFSFRHAPPQPDSWFSYELAVDPDAEHNYLCVRLYGNGQDVGRTWDVLLNGEQFKREVVQARGGFYIQCDEIPADVVAESFDKLDSEGQPILGEDGTPVQVVEVKFQGTGSSWVGGIFGIWIRPSASYDTTSALSGLEASIGTLSPEFSGAVTQYTLTVPSGTDSVDLDLTPSVPSGLVRVDDILIDDTLPRTVAVSEGTVIQVRAYAQDHTTSTSYAITVVVDDGATEEPTASPSPSVTASPSPSPSVSPTPSVSPSQTPSVSPSPSGSVTVTSRPVPPVGDVYSVPGFHNFNGRWWYTECEPYSQTVRCVTEIWSSQVRVEGGRFVKSTGWHFNNLTYLPFMTKAQWGSNPLAVAGEFSSGGRSWRTECNTAATGGNGCRSFIWAEYVAAEQSPSGAWSYGLTEGWVFNNIVRFKG